MLFTDQSADIISVSTLNRMARSLLENGLPPQWIGGEISNLTLAASGHAYFSLKDASAQVRCVMCRQRMARLAFAPREGMQVDGLASKSWDALPAVPDIVITVCASAAGETCPAYLGPVLRTHWGVDDPAHATGTDEQIDAAFMAAYRTLRARIEAMLALPLETLEKAALKTELDRIGHEVC